MVMDIQRVLKFEIWRSTIKETVFKLLIYLSSQSIVWEDSCATAHATLTSPHPHTSSMDKHLTLRCGLRIFFDDACPSNATLYRGHKYT
jgi:hypothetical protein